jgi:hypothetical protein
VPVVKERGRKGEGKRVGRRGEERRGEERRGVKGEDEKK